MKGIFLKKALSLSLLISMSAPMLAVDKQTGLFDRMSDKFYGLFNKSTSTVQTPATPAVEAPVFVDVPAYPVLNVGRPATWGEYLANAVNTTTSALKSAGNTFMDYTLRPANEYVGKPMYNGASSAFSYVWTNMSDNRVVNPVVEQAKQHPYIAAGVATAAVVGTGLVYAYKKGMFSKAKPKYVIGGSVKGCPTLVEDIKYVNAQKVNKHREAVAASRINAIINGSAAEATAEAEIIAAKNAGSDAVIAAARARKAARAKAAEARKQSEAQAAQLKANAKEALKAVQRLPNQHSETVKATIQQVRAHFPKAYAAYVKTPQDKPSRDAFIIAALLE